MSEKSFHVKIKGTPQKINIPEDDRLCCGFGGFETLPRDEAALLKYGLLDRYGHRVSEKPIPMEEVQRRGVQLPGRIVGGNEVLKALGVDMDRQWSGRANSAQINSPSKRQTQRTKAAAIFTLDTPKGNVIYERTDKYQYVVCNHK